jgi:hypothetical protein
MNTAHTHPALIIRVSPALRARLDAHCKQGDVAIPMTQFVRQAIAEKLERDAAERPQTTNGKPAQ